MRVIGQNNEKSMTRTTTHRDRNHRYYRPIRLAKNTEIVFHSLYPQGSSQP